MKLRVRDVCHGDRIASRAIVLQQKTQRSVQFEITPSTRDAIEAWIKFAKLRAGDFLFPSRLHASPHLGTRQYARIVDGWVKEIGLDSAGYGTHPIRRTKPTPIYRRTRNRRAVQLLLGHTKLESTVRSFGIEVDDALEIARANRSLTLISAVRPGAPHDQALRGQERSFKSTQASIRSSRQTRMRIDCGILRPKRPDGCQVHHQLDFCRLLDREIDWFPSPA